MNYWTLFVNIDDYIFIIGVATLLDCAKASVYYRSKGVKSGVERGTNLWMSAESYFMSPDLIK